MATWHQHKARIAYPTPLYHPSMWTVLTDPPCEMASAMLFSTEAAANEFLAKLEKLGKAKHSYILRPAKA